MRHPTISLDVIHAAHIPARRAMLEQLRRQLFISSPWWYVHSEREGPRQWARRAWRSALQQGAEFCLFLNDDALVPGPPIFWGAIYGILADFPAHTVLGLATVDPAQRDAHARGERWLRDGHGVVGWAYGMWRDEVRLLVEEEAKLPADHRSPGHDECAEDCPYWHEDSWMNEVLAKHGIPVWHPVPSIVDHDVSMPSIYDNDHHKHRTAPVTWREYDLTNADFWRP